MQLYFLPYCLQSISIHEDIDAYVLNGSFPPQYFCQCRINCQKTVGVQVQNVGVLNDHSKYSSTNEVTQVTFYF